MWYRCFYTTRNKMYCYTQSGATTPPTPEPPSLSLSNHNSLYREKKKNSISSSLPALVKGKTLSGCHVSQREPADEVGHWECNTYWVSQDLVEEFSSVKQILCYIPAISLTRLSRIVLGSLLLRENCWDAEIPKLCKHVWTGRNRCD